MSRREINPTGPNHSGAENGSFPHSVLPRCPSHPVQKTDICCTPTAPPVSAGLPSYLLLVASCYQESAGPWGDMFGGGCSGFSYSMSFEANPGMLDKTYNSDGFKVFVDQASLLYLDGVEVDFVDTLEGSGFKFNNPQVKSTCGCGSSFSM